MNTPSSLQIDAFLAEQCGEDFGERPEHDWREYIDDHTMLLCERCHDGINLCCGGKLSRDGQGPCVTDPREYHKSLDALFRRCGPVEKCRERGFDGIHVSYELISAPDRWEHEAWVEVGHRDEYRQHVGNGDTPALALAEACYKALQAAE